MIAELRRYTSASRNADARPSAFREDPGWQATRVADKADGRLIARSELVR